MTITRTATRGLGLCFALATAAALLPAQAQPVYRIVGPDGKVTFSDRAPEQAAPGTKSSTVAMTSGGAPNTSGLPAELSKAVQQFPVTLYSGNSCGPCDSARNMLVARGIPFTERTVTTNEDAQALQKISGGNDLPFATIGKQQLIGYADAEWTKYLDAAAYPKKSLLPKDYQRSPATPLVAVQAAKPAADTAGGKTTSRPRPAPAKPTTGPTPSNPAGIRF